MGEAQERHSTRIRKAYKGKHIGKTQESTRKAWERHRTKNKKAQGRHREGVEKAEEKHKKTDMKAQEKHSKHIGIMRKVSDEQRKSIAKA